MSNNRDKIINLIRGKAMPNIKEMIDSTTEGLMLLLPKDELISIDDWARKSLNALDDQYSVLHDLLKGYSDDEIESAMPIIEMVFEEMISVDRESLTTTMDQIYMGLKEIIMPEVTRLLDKEDTKGVKELFNFIGKSLGISAGGISTSSNPLQLLAILKDKSAITPGLTDPQRANLIKELENRIMKSSKSTAMQGYVESIDLANANCINDKEC